MPRTFNREPLFDEDFLRRVRHLALAARRALGVTAGGAHRATDLGDGLEFADHRDYSPGDELRYVDWNIFGRSDRLQVRLFHRHSEQQVFVLLDCSASMGAGAPAKHAFARRCAAALAYLARANLDRVSIAPWAQDAPGAELSASGGRSGRFATILDYLVNLEFAGGSPLAESARQWLSRPRARGLAVLISDCADADDVSAALRRLGHARQQVALLHVHSPQDAGHVPPGPLAVRDPEDPRATLRVNADAALLDAYAIQWQHHTARVRAAAHAVNGVYAAAATDQSWERFLLDCLRRLRVTGA